MQAFAEAKYRIRSVSPRSSVTTSQGLVLSALEPLPEIGDELIVVPGMPYRATERIDPKVIRWLRRAYDAGAAIASVCTGAFPLGDAGLLDGRCCTTHWSRFGELARRFPRTRVLTDRLFVIDGPIVTSAGIASGIDMALALIEQRRGPIVAAEVAREMVVYIRRDGAQEQSSVYLDYRTHLHPGIHRVQDEIVRDPSRKLSIDELADAAAMSRRNLTRLFRKTTGISIKDYVTQVRLERARALLHDPALSVEAVAQRCGFGSARHLRRLWETAHGTSRLRAGV